MSNRSGSFFGGKSQKTNIGPAQLAPVNMLAQSSIYEEDTANKMVVDVRGTENLVDKILELIKQEDREEHKEWPADADCKEGLSENLSHMKMVNEINHRQPRTQDSKGNVIEHSMFWSSFGWHSGHKTIRVGSKNIDLFGPGAILYMRMVKYLCLLFFLFSILSVPSVFIYSQGNNYKFADVPLEKSLAILMPGNLKANRAVVSTFSDVKPSVNLATQVELKCPAG